jgi:nitroreductase
MELFDAIYSRRAVRDYSSQMVGRDTLDRLIDAAIQAPSAVNRQPWIFSIIQDQDLLDRISEKAKALMLASAPAGEMGDHFRTLLSDPAYHIFYHAPALVVISAQTDERWAVEDCSLAAQNFMLAARALGLGTCWIGFADAYLQTPDGKSIIQLDPVVHPVAPIIVGHPKAYPAPVPRKAPRVQWVPPSPL